MIDVMTAVRTVYVLHDLEHRAYLAKTSEDSPIAWHYKERLTQYHADVKAAPRSRLALSRLSSG